MIRSNTCLEACLRVIAEAGVARETVSIGSGGKHSRVFFPHPRADRIVTVIVPSSPSDHRSPANTRRDTKRVLRDEGLWPDEPIMRRDPIADLERIDFQIAGLEARLKALQAARTKLREQIDKRNFELVHPGSIGAGAVHTVAHTTTRAMGHRQRFGADFAVCEVGRTSHIKRRKPS